MPIARRPVCSPWSYCLSGLCPVGRRELEKSSSSSLPRLHAVFRRFLKMLLCASVPLVWYVIAQHQTTQPMYFLLQSLCVTPPPLYFPLTYCVGMWACPREEEDKEKSSTGSTDFSTSADVAQIEHWYCRFVATPPTLNYPLAPREEEDGGLLSTCTGTTNIRTSYRGQRQLSVPAPSSN